MRTIVAPTLKDTVRGYPGCRIGFRLTSKETNDALSVIDMQMTPGSEPVRHYHLWEDETLILHKGTATFFIGDDIINAKAGDIVFIPRTVPHHFVITSNTVHCTLLITPGGLESFFGEATVPFERDILPTADRISTKEEMEIINRDAEKYGIRFV